MNLKKNKKGFAVLGLLAFIFVALIGVYIILYIPIPSFAPIRSMVNYALVIILWIILQIALVYGYYKLGVLVVKGMRIYRSKLHLWVVNVKSFMLNRSR